MTGVFPSVLKTTKVVAVFKKDSKLDCSNYHPISLLSIVDKILEKLMCNMKDFISFPVTIIFSITCSLDSDNILHLIPWSI